MSPRLRCSAVAFVLALAPLAVARPARQDPKHWCNAPGSSDKPGKGRCGDDDAYCHPGSECKHHPPFTSSDGSEPPAGHNKESGDCHDQGCAHHCDQDGCWPDQKSDRRPGGSGDSSEFHPRDDGRLTG
jgi:hypothetical protein